MPISCHFRDCEAFIGMSLAYVMQHYIKYRTLHLLFTRPLRYVDYFACERYIIMQMYYSVSVNVSSPAALVPPILSISKEGIVPSKRSCKITFLTVYSCRPKIVLRRIMVASAMKSEPVYRQEEVADHFLSFFNRRKIISYAK